jgi:hypothetical protein
MSMRLAIIALMLLSGCGGHVLYVDDSFSDSESSDIDYAASEWTRVGYPVWLQRGRPASRNYAYVVRAEPASVRPLKEGEGGRGLTVLHPTCHAVNGSELCGVGVWLAPSDSPVWEGACHNFRQLALHELGHVVGMSHGSDPWSIMGSDSGWCPSVDHL